MDWLSSPPPWKKLKRVSMAAVLATSILATPLTLVTTTSNDHPQESLLSHSPIKVSTAFALSEEQLLVDNVWREVNRQFVDRTFNGLGEEGWRKKRLEAVTHVSHLGPDEQEKVYTEIRTMLSALGDPYTRFLTPDQFESLTAYARGSSSKGGIGVQLMVDPTTGKIVVVNNMGGPAAKGGILPGDIILQVNDEDVDGATAEVVAAKCRGEIGTEVTLAIQHGGDGKPEEKIQKISVTRLQIKSNSVESSIFVSETTKKKIGLIKVSSFNKETEKQVREALNELRQTSAVVMDLRGNPGGYMPAGVDVAKLFLPPKALVISEVDKSGRATIYINDGVGSETSLPLYLLVDQRTASASEILTAALQDNHRATVVGTRTFGKGRIQNIQEVGDGSGIAVTKAKYMTPDGRDIHGVGITPDVESKTCGSNDSPAACLNGLI
jgi:carboxyl-terminal processing protease